MRNDLIRFWPVLMVGLIGVYGLQLQFGLSNHGQEFGTYGPYNRVLNTIRQMPKYTIVNSRLSRRLDWRNIGHLDRFSVTIRNGQGQTAPIEFSQDSPEMNERDPRLLELLIEAKFEAQISPTDPVDKARPLAEPPVKKSNDV